MKHTVHVEQLMSDNNACLNVIGDSGFVGVWAYPFDGGCNFVRLARSSNGHVALLSFGSAAALEEFAIDSLWTFVDIPELEKAVKDLDSRA